VDIFPSKASSLRDHFGVDGDVLVIQASSSTFNPTLDATEIERSYRDDPEAARSEWGAEFRSDLSALLDDAVIDAAIVHSRPIGIAAKARAQLLPFR
jgi:hypothetical protein